jgi:hypothetical protein
MATVHLDDETTQRVDALRHKIAKESGDEPLSRRAAVHLLLKVAFGARAERVKAKRERRIRGQVKRLARTVTKARR